MGSDKKNIGTTLSLSTFETRGALAGTCDGKPSLVLGETIFYPEGGGQLGDTGTLRIAGEISRRCIDTQIDDAGVIHHVLERADRARGATRRSSGAIDVARRRDHMAQHTAQHMLSRALLDEAKAPTVSARLGTSVVHARRGSRGDRRRCSFIAPKISSTT